MARIAASFGTDNRGGSQDVARAAPSAIWRTLDWLVLHLMETTSSHAYYLCSCRGFEPRCAALFPRSGIVLMGS